MMRVPRGAPDCAADYAACDVAERRDCPNLSLAKRVFHCVPNCVCGLCSTQAVSTVWDPMKHVIDQARFRTQSIATSKWCDDKYRRWFSWGQKHQFVPLTVNGTSNERQTKSMIWTIRERVTSFVLGLLSL